MIYQEFGPRRTRAASKPQVTCPGVRFYRCSICGRLVQVLQWKKEDQELSCCDTSMTLLTAGNFAEAGKGLKLDYKITGGYNDNAVQVFFAADDLALRPEWIYLKTFTGGYLRYVNEKKRPPLVFPLADEDAYAYCDEDPCLECTFRCKRGYVIYVYSENMGLIEIPIDRMTAQWQSKADE